MRYINYALYLLNTIKLYFYIYTFHCLCVLFGGKRLKKQTSFDFSVKCQTPLYWASSVPMGAMMSSAGALDVLFAHKLHQPSRTRMTGQLYVHQRHHHLAWLCFDTVNNEVLLCQLFNITNCSHADSMCARVCVCLHDANMQEVNTHQSLHVFTLHD